MLTRWFAALCAFVRKEGGATGVEYAVVLALITLVCVGTTAVLGHKSSGTFTTVGRTVAGS